MKLCTILRGFFAKPKFLMSNYKIQSVAFTAKAYFPSQMHLPDLRTVREMRDPGSILSNFSSSTNTSVPFLVASLNALSNCRWTTQEIRAVFVDQRFLQLLNLTKGRLEDADVRTLTSIVVSLGRFNSFSDEMRDVLQNAADLVMRRENAFSPRDLGLMVVNFSKHNIGDPALTEFFKLEAMKVMANAAPAELCNFLSGFRAWNVLTRDLFESIVDRMCAEIDQFTSKDVCTALAVMANSTLIKGFLIRRLATLAFENLKQFPTFRLVELGDSLAKLRFLNQDSAAELMDEIKPHISELPVHMKAKFVCALSTGNCVAQRDLVESTLRQIRNENVQVQGSWEKELVHAILSFQLTDFDDLLKSYLANVLEKSAMTRRRTVLHLLSEILAALEIERSDLGVIIPPELTALVDDRMAAMASAGEASRIKTSIASLLDHMEGKYKLKWQRGAKVGPYYVELLNEEHKIVMEQDQPGRVNNLMKMRHLDKLGYKPILLPFWQLRRCRTEADQIAFLKQGLDQYLTA